MSKLSKSTRTVIIAAAVLLVLGIVFLVLMLTKPAEETPSASGGSDSSAVSETTEHTAVQPFTDHEGTEVLKAEVTNESGTLIFERDKRVVSTTQEDGSVVSSDQYFWNCAQLMGAAPNDSTIGAFMNCLASLQPSQLVEADAQDLDKYGLESPVSTAKITFDGGESVTVHFGIRNPSSTNFVYTRAEGSSDVYMISYYTVGSAYYPATNFVDLKLTESYNMNNPQELEYFTIARKDLEAPIQMAFMFDIQEEAEDINSVITTFNSHRVTSPIVAEVDSTKGQTICYGLYGLSASTCYAVAADEKTLQETGLDDPFCTLTFKYGGVRTVLHLGNEIVNITESTSPDTPALKTVVGYYGKLDGSDVIYTFATSTAPWYTVQLEEIVSRRPVSPYIYSCDSVVITTPEREYTFVITGDSSVNSITLDGEEVDGDKFRQLYQHLITAVGEELYRVQGDYEPYVSVQFNYREEHHDVYGTASDRLDFYQSDDRKNIVSVNGEVLFKVRQIYTERLLENINALLNGGELQLDW